MNNNNKKAILILLGMAALIVAGVRGCNAKERKQQRKEKQAIENLGQFILDSVNARVVPSLNHHETNIYKTYTDKQLAGLIGLMSGDSALYADALKRDAWMVYNPSISQKEAFAKICNATLYSYGPGTEFDEDGNANYNPKSIKGISPLHNMKVNLENYEDRVRELNKMRAEQARRGAH